MVSLSTALALPNCFAFSSTKLGLSLKLDTEFGNSGLLSLLQGLGGLIGSGDVPSQYGGYGDDYGSGFYGNGETQYEDAYYPYGDDSYDSTETDFELETSTEPITDGSVELETSTEPITDGSVAANPTTEDPSST